MQEDVRRKRNESPYNVRRCDRRSAVSRPLRLLLFQAKLEAHHEIHPGLRLALQRIQNRRALLLTHAIGAENLVDFPLLVLNALDDLALLALALALVVSRVTFRGEISAQAHSDRTSRDLSRSCKNNQPSLAHSASQSRSQRERHR